jgi:protein-tyrosine phosphatase
MPLIFEPGLTDWVCMTDPSAKISVLFVCMGNICRSPTAEAVFRKHLSDAGLEGIVHADSAGTHAYHVGNKPDRRARAAAEGRGYSLEQIRARCVADMDFESFDFILAMDNDNLEALRGASGDEHRDKISLFLDFAESVTVTEVPDPYYGGTLGFERVLDLIEEASAGLLEAVRKRL